MKTYITQLRELAGVTEWTLPQSGLVISDWVGLIQLVTLRSFVGDAVHLHLDKFSCSQTEAMYKSHDSLAQTTNCINNTV